MYSATLATLARHAYYSARLAWLAWLVQFTNLTMFHLIAAQTQSDEPAHITSVPAIAAPHHYHHPALCTPATITATTVALQETQRTIGHLQGNLYHLNL